MPAVMTPLSYLRQELYPTDSKGFMAVWKELGDSDKEDLKKWAKEELGQ